MGSITNWNDKAIAQLNPTANLPNLPVITVHRADGSGTTYIFTDYLSHVSATWKSQIGTGKSVNWPAAASLGAKGNEGVAGQVRNNPGAIGYVELAYALENDMAFAAIRNKDGAFISPTLDSVRAAAAQKATVSPTDFSIVDQNSAGSYPICGYSWVMLWKNQSIVEERSSTCSAVGDPDSRRGKVFSCRYREHRIWRAGACGSLGLRPGPASPARTPAIKNGAARAKPGSHRLRHLRERLVAAKRRHRANIYAVARPRMMRASSPVSDRVRH